MSDVIKKTGEKVKSAWKYSIQTSIFKCFVLALALELLLEILGRRSFIRAFSFMINSPFVYLYNVSIIFFTLLFALFLRKRIFGIILITTIWMICGIVNFIVLGFRVTPFAAIDFLMARDVLSMIDIYLAKWQQVLVVVLIILLIAGIVFLFIKCPKTEDSRKISLTMLECIIVWFVVIGLTNFGVNHNIISDDFANLGMAYQDYGFAYCFTNSIIDNGIEMPDDYSKADMLAIKRKLEAMPNIGDMKNPNIIYIQLESFFDPKTVQGLTLSKDPVPTFTKLKKLYPSGYLTVPALGAGTANTEFEVMTSLSSSSFGAGEYPYKTTVNKVPVEGVASLLKSVGYNTFAIHNNTATFYDRNRVYEQMGYDHFISLEYMYDVSKTSTGWAKDYSLINDIMTCLKSTGGRDLVYTISVQGHGRYPKEEGGFENYIQLEYENKAQEVQFHYYVNQIYEMDLMIAQLIRELDAYNEPYVLVLYGDHLPTLDITDELLSNGNVFQTEYVIVNNIDLKLKDADISATELSGRLFKELCLPMSFAQKANICYEGEERKEVLNKIAYDMLFGVKFIYEEKPVVSDTDLQMGVLPITISSASNEDDHIVIKGENFNMYSVVYINGDEVNTTYIDRSTLMIADKQLSDGASVVVSQRTEAHRILGDSEAYIYTYN